MSVKPMSNEVVDYRTAQRFHCDEIGPVKRYKQVVLVALAQLEPDEPLKSHSNDVLAVNMRFSCTVDTARELIVALQAAINSAPIG